MDKYQGRNGDNEEALNDAEVVVLTDDQGRSLSCYLERTFDVNGDRYALLLPVDPPIEIFAWDVVDDNEDEENLVDIPDDELDEVFPTARAVLAEQNIALQRTAVTLTATGEIPVPEDDDIITLDLGEDEPDLEAEQLQLLATFYQDEQEYSVYTPLDPLLICVRLKGDGTPELLSPEEFQVMRSQLEEYLFEDL
ncbi:MAG: DUF3727 domain-containing protein [Elainellaceae cyanobacterium]